MTMKTRRVLKVVVALLVLLLIPVAGWLVALQISPSASILGPYVLVSPVATVVIFFWIGLRAEGFSWPPRRETEYQANRTIASVLEHFAELAGVEIEDVRCFRPKPRWNHVETFLDDKVAFVNAHWWGANDESTRNFSIAHWFATSGEGRSGWITTVMDILYLVGCVLVSLNIWLVFPVHLVGLFAVACIVVVHIDRVAVKADRKSLEWTRDLTAALRFVTSWEPLHGKRLTGRRIKALRKAAAEMGIAA